MFYASVSDNSTITMLAIVTCLLYLTFPYQVRGFLLNFGVYHATRAALGLSFQWRLVIICTTFDK